MKTAHLILMDLLVSPLRPQLSSSLLAPAASFSLPLKSSSPAAAAPPLPPSVGPPQGSETKEEERVR